MLLWLAMPVALAGVFGSEEGTLVGGTVIVSHAQVAFNDRIAPGLYGAQGVGLGVTGGSLQGVVSGRLEGSIHTRWTTPAAIEDAVPSGYELDKRWVAGSLYIAGLLDGKKAGGPYLEAGTLFTFPIAQSLPFERAEMSLAGGGGERWLFDNGLLVDVGVRVHSPQPRPEAIAIPTLFVVRVGGGSVQ